MLLLKRIFIFIFYLVFLAYFLSFETDLIKKKKKKKTEWKKEIDGN